MFEQIPFILYFHQKNHIYYMSDLAIFHINLIIIPHPLKKTFDINISSIKMKYN